MPHPDHAHFHVSPTTNVTNLTGPVAISLGALPADMYESDEITWLMTHLEVVDAAGHRVGGLTLEYLPYDASRPSPLTGDPITISGFPKPGWYTLRIPDQGGVLAQLPDTPPTYPGQMSLLKVGDTFTGDYLVGTSSPGIRDVFAFDDPDTGGSKVGITFSEPLERRADATGDFELLDASGNVLSCTIRAGGNGIGPSTPNGGSVSEPPAVSYDCPRTPIAGVRAVDPPVAADGTPWAFPAKGTTLALDGWVHPDATNWPTFVVDYPPRRAMETGGTNPVVPPNAAPGGCATAGGAAAFPAFLVLALLAVRRLWRPT